jgi:WD40 repeat protein
MTGDFHKVKTEPPAYGPAKIVFSQNSQYFTAGYDLHVYGNGHNSQLLQLWDAKTGKIIRQTPHGTMPEFVAFTPDSRHLITSAEGLIRIWDVPLLTERAQWKVNQGFHNIALSPDGSSVAATVGGRIEVRSVPSGRLLGSLTPMGVPGSVGFTPNSRILVAISGISSQTAAAQFWDWPAMKEVSRFSGLAGSFPAISFSPDGRYLVLQQMGGVERYLWRPEDLIEQGCRTLLVVKKPGDLASICSSH